MDEIIEIAAGTHGEYLTVFDGRVLELFGQSGGSARYRASQLIFKREKPGKDGSIIVRCYTAHGEGWQFMTFGPDSRDQGERLLAALLVAGAQQVT